MFNFLFIDCSVALHDITIFSKSSLFLFCLLSDFFIFISYFIFHLGKSVCILVYAPIDRLTDNLMGKLKVQNALGGKA